MNEENEGIVIHAYIGSCTLSQMGKRTIRLDIPEDQAIPFMAAMSMYSKLVEVKIREIEEED